MMLMQVLCVGFDLQLCPSFAPCSSAERALDRHGIDCRRWYSAGVQGHSYFARLSQRDRLDATNDILPRLIGLPVAPDLSQMDIRRVVDALRPLLFA